ncbi:MAG: SDR family NAD(P)-dependent oxidoreductase, partial [Myxococcota bacterium]|nr:SDR family NAD(P)-dependent oxidoreductase [Myxococcota bacterium]
MTTRKFPRAIVVGASSGIGAAVARGLGREGATVALVARRADRLEAIGAEVEAAGGKCIVVEHDVTDYDSVPATFDRLVGALGGLDLVVYAAGVMTAVDEHEYAFDKDRQMVEVNLLGAMAWLNPSVAHMEAARSGVIVGVSSIAGARGRRGNPGYGASKAALSTWLEGLRNKAHRYGVGVVTVKPGFVDTDMFRGAGLDGTPPGLGPISADACAARILSMARKGSVSGFVPRRWGLVAAIIAAIPSWLFRKTNV